MCRPLQSKAKKEKLEPTGSKSYMTQVSAKWQGCRAWALGCLPSVLSQGNQGSRPAKKKPIPRLAPKLPCHVSTVQGEKLNWGQCFCEGSVYPRKWSRGWSKWSRGCQSTLRSFYSHSGHMAEALIANDTQTRAEGTCSLHGFHVGREGTAPSVSQVLGRWEHLLLEDRDTLSTGSNRWWLL